MRRNSTLNMSIVSYNFVIGLNPDLKLPLIWHRHIETICVVTEGNATHSLLPHVFINSNYFF